MIALNVGDMSILPGQHIPLLGQEPFKLGDKPLLLAQEVDQLDHLAERDGVTNRVDLVNILHHKLAVAGAHPHGNRLVAT